MADNKEQNKDAQSGEPVQLDKEQGGQRQGDDQSQSGQQQQAGQRRPQQAGQPGNPGAGQQQGAQHEGRSA